MDDQAFSIRALWNGTNAVSQQVEQFKYRALPTETELPLAEAEIEELIIEFSFPMLSTAVSIARRALGVVDDGPDEWKEYGEEFAKQVLLIFAYGFWGAKGTLRSLLDLSEEEIEERAQLMRKVLHPEQVQSFEEGREIAQRLHRYTALFLQGYYTVLYHHLMTEHFHLLSDHAGERLSREEARALVGKDHLLKAVLVGININLDLDFILEELQWSDRAAWPSSYTFDPQSAVDIQRDLRKEVASVIEQQSFQTPAILKAQREQYQEGLNEVEAAIKEVEEKEWEDFGACKRPLAFELHRNRLLAYRSQLSVRKRLLGRFFRECLGGVFQSTLRQDNQEASQQLEQGRLLDTVKKRAVTIFEGKSRAPTVGTNIHGDVRVWAVESFHTFRGSGYGSEAAKTKVIGIAEEHNYHFTRRWLEEEIKKQNGS